MLPQIRKTPLFLPSGEKIDLLAIPKPNRLLWERMALTADAVYVGWFLNNIPLLDGDVLEWLRAENLWQPVEYIFSYEEDRSYFADPTTRQRLLSPSFPTSDFFCWPYKEATRLVKAYERERPSKRKRSAKT